MLATRIEAEKAEVLLASFLPGDITPIARTFRIDQVGLTPAREGLVSRSETPTAGLVSIVTAGTSDIAVAEEVRETADWMGAGTDLIVDVGVAGPQRLHR